MNVRLPRQLSRYVADKVASGRYADSNEVIREALRQMEERETRQEPAMLQSQITAGLHTPLRPVTAAGWKAKWEKGIEAAAKLRTERRRAA